MNRFLFCCRGRKEGKRTGAFILSSAIYSLALSRLKENAPEHMKGNKGAIELDAGLCLCVMFSADGEKAELGNQKEGVLLYVCFASGVLISLLNREESIRNRYLLKYSGGSHEK